MIALAEMRLLTAGCGATLCTAAPSRRATRCRQHGHAQPLLVRAQGEQYKLIFGSVGGRGVGGGGRGPWNKKNSDSLLCGFWPPRIEINNLSKEQRFGLLGNSAY